MTILHRMKTFSKILVANRGEIALRVFRTAKKMGIKSVAIYSDSDEDAMHVKQADESYHIGSDNLAESYLNIEKIIQIAKITNCEAIHPGFGFLSENPDFAHACKKNKITFIGPNKSIIKKMGNKIEANQYIKKLGIPTIENKIGNSDYLLKQVPKLGFPILLKAAAGGGGKGMRIIREQKDLREAIEATSREAQNYFGNPDVFAERYIENPRHIEVQILGDSKGNVIHLFERECSIQRRYQKIIEEAPSKTLNTKVRNKICQAAVEIGQKSGYENAGTIEFLVDKDLNFYFLEMNTRIQVEHPVTEMITGIDIVEQQIKIAAGYELDYKQSDIKKKGHAIECRVYAENPAENFKPSPGKINFHTSELLENTRIESAIESNTEVYSFFDPMVSKLVAWGKNREEARKTILKLLQSYIIHGIESNTEFLKTILLSKDYIQNKISTSYCDNYKEKIIGEMIKLSSQTYIAEPVIVYLLIDLQQKNADNHSIWNEIGYWREMMQFPVILNNQEIWIEILSHNQNGTIVKIDGETYHSNIIEYKENKIAFSLNNNPFECYTSLSKDEWMEITFKGLKYKVRRKNLLIKNFQYTKQAEHLNGNTITSPLPGKILKIKVQEGDTVTPDTSLLIIEAMKMENNIFPATKARVTKIHVEEGELVESGIVLVELEELEGMNNQF